MFRTILTHAEQLDLEPKFWLALLLAGIEKHHADVAQQGMLGQALTLFRRLNPDLNLLQNIFLQYPIASKHLLTTHSDLFTSLAISNLIALTHTFPEAFTIIVQYHANALSLNHLCQMTMQDHPISDERLEVLKGKNALLWNVGKRSSVLLLS